MSRQMKNKLNLFSLEESDSWTPNRQYTRLRDLPRRISSSLNVSFPDPGKRRRAKANQNKKSNLCLDLKGIRSTKQPEVNRDEEQPHGQAQERDSDWGGKGQGRVPAIVDAGVAQTLLSLIVSNSRSSPSRSSTSTLPKLDRPPPAGHARAHLWRCAAACSASRSSPRTTPSHG